MQTRLGQPKVTDTTRAARKLRMRPAQLVAHTRFAERHGGRCAVGTYSKKARASEHTFRRRQASTRCKAGLRRATGSVSSALALELGAGRVERLHAVLIFDIFSREEKQSK